MHPIKDKLLQRVRCVAEGHDYKPLFLARVGEDKKITRVVSGTICIKCHDVRGKEGDSVE